MLRTALALQQLAYVRLAVQASNQIDTPPVNATNCQNWDIDLPNSTDRSFPLRLSSCISTTRPTPATLVERPAAHIYDSTIPAVDIIHLAEDYVQPPRTLLTRL